MSHPIAVKTLLHGTRQELAELHHIAEGLQAVISTCDTSSSEAIEAIQRLDYLTQSLEALSVFWLQTENEISSDLSVNCHNALQNMPLKDLAKSLGGHATKMPQAEQGVLEEF